MKQNQNLKSQTTERFKIVNWIQPHHSVT